eukprot:3000644-Amphidinium_carterae.1
MRGWCQSKQVTHVVDRNGCADLMQIDKKEITKTSDGNEAAAMQRARLDLKVRCCSLRLSGRRRRAANKACRAQ